MLSIVVAISGNRADRSTNFLSLLGCINRQTFKDYELIVVEQSTDAQFYWRWLASTDVKYIPIQHGVFNLSWCYNVAARKASGDILVFLGGDVGFGNDYFESIANGFKPPYMAGWNSAIYLNPEGLGYYLNMGYTSEWEDSNVAFVASPECNSGYGLSTIFTKDFFWSLGGFNETYESWGGEDQDIHVRAREATGVDIELPYTILHLFHGASLPCDPEKDAILTATCQFPNLVTKKLLSVGMGQSDMPRKIPYLDLADMQYEEALDEYNISARARTIALDASKIPGFYQSKTEFARYIDTVLKENPKFILEIGVAHGGSLFGHIKSAADDATIIALDIAPFDDVKRETFNSWVGPNQKLILISGDSHSQEILDRVKEVLGENQLDVLFVDGDHSMRGAESDDNMYSPLLRLGGVRAFHDIVNCVNYGSEVDRYWELRRGRCGVAYKVEAIVDKENYPWTTSMLSHGIGVIRQVAEEGYVVSFYRDNLLRIEGYKDLHRGERCFIVATGPSLEVTNLELIKGEILWGMNTLYTGLDRFGIKCKYWSVSDENIWWKHADHIVQVDSELLLSHGAAVAWMGQHIHAGAHRGVPPTLLMPLSHVISGRYYDLGHFSKDPTQGLMMGGTVVIANCLQMAYYMGFSEVYILGCDCDYSGKHRFDGLKSWKKDPDPDIGWSKTFEAYKLCRDAYEADGRKLYNATVGGKLPDDVLERVSLEELA